MKRLISALLAVIITVSVTPASVFAFADESINSFLSADTDSYPYTGGDYTNGDAEEEPTDGLEYLISDGQATVTGYNGDSSEVVIPDTIEGYPVTTIGDDAFLACTALKKITLPRTLKAIGNSAFSFTGLTAIVIPDGVITIGDYAFEFCDKMTNVDIPDSVTYIGENAFYWCQKLSGVTIPSGITSISDYAFYECISMKSAILPERLESIGYSAFAGCTALTGITIPNTVTYIGEWAFFNCSKITRVVIPESVTVIADWAFYCWHSLKTVYYYGPAESWAKINIGKENDPLLNADLVFLGDVNGDGVTNAMDSQHLRMIILSETYVEPDSYQLLSADLNFDKMINTKDSYIMKKIIAKMT